LDVLAALSTPQIDLVGLGSVTQLISLDRAPPGKDTQLRIVINSVTGVLADGTSVNVTVPDSELKTVTPFDLAGGGSVAITMNFDLASSVHGADDMWTFRPVLGSIEIARASRPWPR